MAKALTRGGKVLRIGGKIATDSCSGRCCDQCRTYYKLFACTVNTPTICGIVPVEPPPIYLWTGAKCGENGPVITPGDVVFLVGRCWRVGFGEFNDRNGTCPEPRVPEAAQVFDNLYVDCINQGCAADICQDALEGFVQAEPCGIIQGEQVIHYTCRSYLTRCFVTKLFANPNDPDSVTCYKFDPAGPAINPSQLPPTAQFWGNGIIATILNSNPPDTCCACEVATRSGIEVIEGNCDNGTGQNTRQTIGGVVDLGDVACCCGRTEDWENAQITLSDWTEEQFFDTGNTTFLTRVTLDSPLVFRNGDAANGIDFQVVQRDYVNGIQTGQNTIALRIFFQQCGALIVEDFGLPPGFSLATDYIERRQNCTVGSYRHQFGPPESRFIKSWTIRAQYPEARVPCVGGCEGRLIGTFRKGGIATNTGCASCGASADIGSGGATI